MEALSQLLFVFTLGIVLLNIVWVIAIIARVDINFPYIIFKNINIGDWWIYYPTYFYQIWWWSTWLGLI